MHSQTLVCQNFGIYLWVMLQKTTRRLIRINKKHWTQRDICHSFTFENDYMTYVFQSYQLFPMYMSNHTNTLLMICENKGNILKVFKWTDWIIHTSPVFIPILVYVSVIHVDTLICTKWWPVYTHVATRDDDSFYKLFLRFTKNI